MNKYTALVKKIDDDIEEEVTLSINGFDVICFAGVCPYEIYEGKKYPVYFEMVFFDDYSVQESSKKISNLERIGNGFSYWIVGKLKGDTIDSSIQFKDEILLSDYGYLNDKYIRIKADRIDVEFLTE